MAHPRRTRTSTRQKIGECLVQAGLITEDNLRAALIEHEHQRGHIGEILVRMKFATDKQVAEALARQLGFPYVSLAANPPAPTVVALVARETAREYLCLAIELERNVLTVAMADPLQFSLVQDLEIQTGYRIKPVVAVRSEILDAIGTAYPDVDDVADTGAEAGIGPGHGADALPVADLASVLIGMALANAATDIHIEPTERCVRIRHRLDGLLTDVLELPTRLHEELTNQIKTIAGMEIAEKRLPQDGRLRASGDKGVSVDFRVSTLRTAYGEKVVMRMLDDHKRAPALDAIGLSPRALEDFQGLLRRRQGLILIVGPKGSGKTTTASAALASIAVERTNSVTIEDPIEYQIGSGVIQTAIGAPIDGAFARALRSVLAQDPDVILIGELRDTETTEMTMRAARSGLLLLSTLPADDAPAAVNRLVDLGVAPGVIASAVVGVVTERLVRRLCGRCRQPSVPRAEILHLLNVAEDEGEAGSFFSAVGCDQCHYTGYRGRIGLFEVMTVDDTLRRLITSRAADDDLREGAIAGGLTTLGEDGLAKVRAGVTTLEELLRVVTEPKGLRALCRSCGAVVAVNFMACPRCGTRLDHSCRHCGRSLRPGWTFCPYCARSTSSGTLPGRLS